MYSSGLSLTWERNEWAESAAGTYTPFGGARAYGILDTIRYWITQLYPDTFPWDRIRVEKGRAMAMDVEGAGHAPGASMVTTGASSTTTNQDPAQAGSHLPPQ